MTLVEENPRTARMKRANLQLTAAFDPPRSDLERQIEGFWMESIAVDSVGRNDDFFEIGGDSLAAERIALRLEALSGDRFSGSDLIEHSTIAALAEVLAARIAGQRSDDQLPVFLNVVQKNGSLPPLFCIHGGLGVLSPGRVFFDTLGPDRPVYLFQAPGMNGRHKPLASYEEFTTEYLAAIRKVQPHGPYNILAYCAFCFVAFEIARRLVAEGEVVENLILLDPMGMPPALCFRHGWMPEHHIIYNNGLRMLGRAALALPPANRVPRAKRTEGEGWERELARFADQYASRRSGHIKDRMDRLNQTAEESALPVDTPPLFDPGSVETTLRTMDRALGAYMPSGRYKGRAYLVRTEEFLSPYTKWWNLNVSDLKKYQVKGSHNALWQSNLAAMSKLVADILAGRADERRAV